MGKKKKNITNECKVFYSDLWGKRSGKHAFLYDNSIKTVDWIELKPEKENYFFTVKDFKSITDYEKGYKIDEIFKVFSSGVKFRKDNLLVNKHFNKESVLIMLNDIKSLKENEVLNKYSLSETGDWKLKEKKEYFLNFKEESIKPVNYRPFDVRFTYYPLDKINKIIPRGDSRLSFMKNLLKENISIVLSRQLASNLWNHSFINRLLIDMNFISISSKEANFIFPIYIHEGNNSKESNLGLHFKEEGITDNFTDEFKQYFKSKYSGTYTPEQILGYIYAVLHSPTYRTKYIEFLKIDFPRIPFTDDESLFGELSAIGTELIEHHLLKKTYSDNICRIEGTGENFKVEKVEYEEMDLKESREANFLHLATGEKSGRVWINKERCFEPIPEPIWNFYIGGYQVLEKWLKERKKHEITLSSEDIQHFIKVVNVLDATIRIMKVIDDKTKEWI